MTNFAFQGYFSFQSCFSFQKSSILFHCSFITFEPGQSISYETACVPSENTDQPARPLGLIRVFAVRMKDILGPWLSIQRTVDQTAWMDRMI